MKIRGELYLHGLIPVTPPFAPSPDLTSEVKKGLQIPCGRAQSHNWITTDGAGAWELNLVTGLTISK